MEIGNSIIFKMSINDETLEGKGILIREVIGNKKLVIVKDIFVGNSDYIGKKLTIFDDEVVSSYSKNPIEIHKPRKLKYHEENNHNHRSKLS